MKVDGTAISMARREHPAALDDSLTRVSWRLATLSFAGAATALPALISEPAFWCAHVTPLLAEARGSAGQETGVRVARTFGSQSDGAILQLFVWPPGSATMVHDHCCWGVLHCIWGAFWEERFERLDDAGQIDVAHLRQSWVRQWRRQDGVTALLPYNGGIHRVSNPGAELAITAHIYGPRLGLADGRDFDPNRDYVCDRFEL